ncbi:MAG: hypothetical protein OSB47_16165, partial [Pirellulaceae bacterium]|nr:hypothetical protein [Pirellulaceae bacterium]
MKQPIQRRTFGQVLATAAGAMGVAGADDPVEGQEGKHVQQTVVKSVDEAVTVSDLRELARGKLPGPTF